MEAGGLTSTDGGCWLAEGVLYAEKDFNLAEHPDIPGVPNLQVSRRPLRVLHERS